MDWFRRLTGFAEVSYEHRRERVAGHALDVAIVARGVPPQALRAIAHEYA